MRGHKFHTGMEQWSPVYACVCLTLHLSMKFLNMVTCVSLGWMEPLGFFLFRPISFFFLPSLGKIMSFSVISKGISNLKIKNKRNLRGKELCLSRAQFHFSWSRTEDNQSLKHRYTNWACLVEIKCSQDPLKWLGRMVKIHCIPTS